MFEGCKLRKKKWSLLTALILITFAISTISTIIVLSYSSPGNRPNSTPNDGPSSNPTLPSLNANPTPRPDIKIVNKQIPSGYTMGLPIDAGLINGMTVAFIQNPSDKVSIRFTAKLGGTVSKLVIYAFAFEGQPTVRIGLQEDVDGTPKGEWMNSNAFGCIQMSNSSGFKTVELQTNVAITKGQVYHIVVEPTESSNGTTAVETYQANGAGQPFNPDDPDIVWNDARMNTLSYAGQGWQEQNKWPIFVIGYSDGRLEGQPYSLIAQWVVWGSTYVGQTIIPASDYKIGKIAFDVSLNSGGSIPQDKLYYQIRDSSNAILAQGVFAESGQLAASQTWIETSLVAPITLKAGQLYRIILLSPQTTLDKAYYLFGHEFSYDPTIGYGGLQHQLTSSLDGAVSWGDNPDADAVFRLTTTG